METGKFVETLDKLNRLKDEGILDENEYEKQVNKLKNEYSKASNNYYGRNYTNNTNITSKNNTIAFLFLFFILIIGGIWFFSSNIFKNLTTTSKKIINDIESYTTSLSDYNYNTLWSSNNYSISGTDSSKTITYNNDSKINTSNNNSSNVNSSSNNSNNQAKVENKKTYNINVRKDARLFNKGDIILTVLNYQTETYNSKVGSVKDGQEWVILNMKFENKSNSTVIIDKNDFKIVDGAGKYGYRPYYKHLDTELDLVEIRAGQTATFSVRFVYYQNNEMFLRYYNSDLETHSYDEYIDMKLR